MATNVSRDAILNYFYEIDFTAPNKTTRSADMSGAKDQITATPASGKTQHMVGILVWADTDMTFTVTEEGESTVIEEYFLAARLPFLAKGKLSELTAADNRYEAQTSVAGNIFVKAWVVEV